MVLMINTVALYTGPREPSSRRRVMTRSLRRDLLTAALVLLTALAVACQPASQPAPAPTTAAPGSEPTSPPAAPAATTAPLAAPAAKPAVAPAPAQVGGQIILTQADDPVTLDPAISALATTIYHSQFVFDGLTRPDKNLRPSPSLAESWDVSSDG